MKTLRLAILCVATVLCTTVASAAAPTQVGDFALLDQNGKFHQLSWYGDHKAIVVFVQGNGCPIVRNGVHAMKTVRDEFEGRDVAFFMLNSQTQDDRAFDLQNYSRSTPVPPIVGEDVDRPSAFPDFESGHCSTPQRVTMPFPEIQVRHWHRQSKRMEEFPIPVVDQPVHGQ